MANTGEQHLLSIKKLAAILVVLLTLTGLTIGMSYVDLGRYNVPLTLTIASTKATLVLLFFMHLKFEGPAIRYSLIGTIGFLAVMIGFTFWDVAYR
jgi:cytochrome c oxidase subunit 4